jgi:hypothetical protein
MTALREGYAASARRTPRRRALVAGLCLVGTAAICGASVFKTIPPVVSALAKSPGSTLGQGGSYRLEEYRLSQPVQIDVGGGLITTFVFWKLTVTDGGPYRIQDNPLTIQIGDGAAGVGDLSSDGKGLSTITFDRSLLVEGARLSVMDGDPRDGGNAFVLPETLHLLRTPAPTQGGSQ